MAPLYYRLSSTEDPEERLEDACLWKAMHDTYGDGITAIPSNCRAPKEGVLFGRSRHFESDHAFVGRHQTFYGRDPGFEWGASRRHEICDLPRAEALIAEIHAEGKDAFIKSTAMKLAADPVPRGESLSSVLGNRIWSFVDREDCLLVQDFVKMRHERRFVVIAGEIVTHSPVAFHLTPIDRARLFEDTGHPVSDLHFETPEFGTPLVDAALSRRMEAFVTEVVARSDMKDTVIDVAELEDGRIEVIEFNPVSPGGFGLFACDPYAIAEASAQLLPDDVINEAAWRWQEGEPAPVPSVVDGAEEEGADHDETYLDIP